MKLPVGVPKELKIGERRVGLSPEGVNRLMAGSIPVLVERGAGELSDWSDRDYEAAGGRLVRDRKKLWQEARIIKKVKEPVLEEFEFFTKDHIIFSFLHLASPASRPLIDALLKNRVTAIGYETVEVAQDTPILKPMSVVAGILGAYFSGVFRTYVKVHDGVIQGFDKTRSVMEQVSAEYPQVPKHLNPGAVVVLGGGHVGSHAARMVSRMGGEAVVSEISEDRRKRLRKDFSKEGHHITVLDPSVRETYHNHLLASDCIIGAVHSIGERAPAVIDQKLLGHISERKKKIVIDIAIDQGGNVAESRPTTYEDPIYLDSFGNLRFSVSNVPSLSGRGATIALEKASLPYTRALAGGCECAFQEFPELRSGLNVMNGKLIHPAVREAHGMN